MAKVDGVISVARGQEEGVEGKGKGASRISHFMLHVVASSPLPRGSASHANDVHPCQEGKMQEGEVLRGGGRGGGAGASFTLKAP